MKVIFRIFVPLLLIITTACNTLTKDIEVSADKDPKARISGYESYTWLDDPALLLNDPKGEWQPPALDVAKEIKLQIAKQLEARGMSLTEDNPELVVGFFLGVDMQALSLKYDPEFEVDILQSTPKAGLLVVLIDATTRFVIWMGSAEAEIHKENTSEQTKQRVEYAVSELFKLLPDN